MCGAAASTDATQCLYCSSRLATVACPSCFGMMFLGSRHCSRCGAQAARSPVAEAKPRRCPPCRTEMEAVAIGSTTLHECAQCGGLWVDAESFEKICADREQQATVLKAVMPQPAPAGDATRQRASNVRYVRCPECDQMMNRMNFARCSGVIVDICKKHGTWFDCNELQQLVEFIRAGGLETSRAREKEQLAEEWRKLRQEQFSTNVGTSSHPFMTDEDDRRSIVNVTVREFLKFFLD